MSDGWAIPVIIKNGEGHETRQIFYARFEDRIDAEQAVRKQLGKTSKLLLDEQTPVASQVFDEMKVAQSRVTVW